MTDRPLIRFHGATHTVTGSCTSLEWSGRRILIDCGLFQGSKTEKELNYRAFPFVPRDIDAVILTHAHIDHSGLIPKLVKDGFRGPVFATPATVDLAAVMLADSGHIQETEVSDLNRRNRRRGRRDVTPIYTAEEAAAATRHLRAVPLGIWTPLGEGLRFRLWNAGHLLGSASVELECGDGTDHTRLLFSGDIGPANKLLQPDPEAPKGWDYVIVESTYGDRTRTPVSEAQRRGILRAEVKAALRPAGALIIPSFAVERTQELIADLVQLMDSGDLPALPVIIDSPLATRASQIFLKHAAGLDHGDLLARAMASHHVRFTESVEQSKALDTLRDFHIVISASGMCEAGRIRHRLGNWLWREEATVLLVGYQAAGTLGRLLQDGASRVRIRGEEIDVRARIRSLDLYSGHADAGELVGWLTSRLPVTGGVFLVHGEEEAIAGLAGRLAPHVPADRILAPALDSLYRLDPDGAADLSHTAAPPRIDPLAAGRLDWHNDYQALILDIQRELGMAADDRARRLVLRRLRRAIEPPPAEPAAR